MARKRGSPHHHATRRQARHHHRVEPDTFDAEAQPLIRTLRDALRSEDPTVFLVAGTMVAALVLDPITPTPAGDAGLLDSFLDVDIAETTALLHLVAALTDDDLQRARIERVLAGRRQPVPATVRELGQARIDRAWFMGDELGDGDNVILGVDFPSGAAITGVMFIDHNLGTIAKDAFFIGLPADTIIAKYTEFAGERLDADPPVPLDLASARARIEQAIANFVESGYVPEDDPEQPSTWPQCSVLLIHLVGQLPEGGTGYDDEEHDCDPLVIESTVTAFLESEQAVGLDGDPGDIAALAEALVHFAMHTGDPLRWSGASAEICLTQDLPFEIGLTEDQLDLVPDVLPALVRYSHAEQSISDAGTAETLGSITRWLPEFDELRDLAASNRDQYQQVQAMLTASPRERAVQRAQRAAGTEEFDAAPLPDEPLILDGVPEDLHAVVTEISGHLDQLIADGGLPDFDVEFRTACRRFLTRVAEAGPEVLRRRAKTLNTAASIAWVVGRANELVGYPPAPVSAKSLQESMGVKTLSSNRARALIRTVQPRWTGQIAWGVYLGTPDLLVSRFRRRLLEWIDTASDTPFVF